MSKQMRLIAIFVVAILALVGVFCARKASKVRVDVNRLVVNALFNDDHGEYIAQVSTETLYNGTSVKTSATVFHCGKVEKIESTGSSGSTIWSMTQNGNSYTYLPDGNKLLVSEPSRLISEKERAELLLRNYRAECLGMDEAASRSAYVVRLSPIYRGNPSKKLWIDAKNYTILQSVDYSADGQQRGSTMVEKIDFNVKVDLRKFILPSRKSVEFVRVCRSGDTMNLFKDLGFSVGTPHYVPSGYKLEGYHLFNCQCRCGHHAAQLTYTDGLNVISVFQTPTMKSCPGCKMSVSEKNDKCVGASCGMAMTGQVARRDKSIIVVGDLLPEDIRKIAQSVD